MAQLITKELALETIEAEIRTLLQSNASSAPLIRSRTDLYPEMKKALLDIQKNGGYTFDDLEAELKASQ